MLVRSAVRSNSTSSSEHDAYLASLLLTSGDDAGSEPAPPANPAESGSAAAPPTGSDSRRVPPPFTRASSLRVKRTNVFVGTRQSDLEKLQNLEAEIASLVLQILGIEREVEKVQECIASGSEYRGRKGEALGAVEGKLVSKELLLREEKKQLRDEKMMLVRLQGSNNSEPKMTAATASSKKIEASVPAAPQKHVSFVVTSAFVDDPAGEREEQQRLSQVNEVIQRRRSSLGRPETDAGGSTDAVVMMHKIEEDSRLLARLSALEMPILVSTLLAGFTLVMFEIASTDLARLLTVLSFALESSASTILCLIAFRGQQLYSYATDVNPLTRRFLRRVRPVTVVALLTFALGVLAFVLAFVIEAIEELGSSWVAVVAVVFCPTLVAGVLFAVSTVQVRRYSVKSAPLCSE